MGKKELAKKAAVVRVTAKEDKKTALEGAIKMIEKKYGAGAVMRLGQTKTLNVDAIPTGSMTLDMALGIGGVPRGRIVEIYGPESSGKTTVALSITAQAQKAGGEAAFIDVEHALDPVYAQALGVDIENLLVSQPDSGEQALEIAEALIRSGAIDVIVIDSIAAMTTKAEIDGEMGDLHVGQLARLMSQAMRKLTSAISRSNCVAIFINQIREKIGVMYGNPETTPGGRALKFYASVRIDVRKGEVIKNGSEIIGASTKCRIVKNKVAPPFKECTFDMMYGTGISRTGEILDLATDLEIIKKSGSWFSYKDQKLGQGRDNVKELLKNDPELMKDLEEQILARKDEITLVKPDKKDPKSKRGRGKNSADDDADIEENSTSEDNSGMESDDILANIDEDFEEFTPAADEEFPAE